MSNLSLAVFTGDVIVQIEDKLEGRRLIINPSKFDYKADAHLYQKGKTSVLWIRGSDLEALDIFFKIADQLDGQPWLCLRFPDKIVWEYDLYRGTQLIDQFMPLPHLWGKPNLFPASPLLLVDIWGNKVSNISNYLVEWKESNRGKKAYWSDHFRFGNAEQGFDFLRRLTGVRIPRG